MPLTEFNEMSCWFDFLSKLRRNFSVELERMTVSAPGLTLMLDSVERARFWSPTSPPSVFSVGMSVGFLIPSGRVLVSEGGSVDCRGLFSEVLASGVVTLSAAEIWEVDCIPRLCVFTEEKATFFWKFSSSGVVQECSVLLSPMPPLHKLESRTNNFAPFISTVWNRKIHVKFENKFLQAFGMAASTLNVLRQSFANLRCVEETGFCFLW